MATSTIEDLGEFTQGEIPISNLLNTFQDSAGQPIPITGMQVRFTYREHWTNLPATRNGSIVNGPAGQGGYVWDGSEFAYPGQWEGDLWVGNGITRLASDRFRWTVRAAVGSVPAI
jgi:hypothetical protein